MKIKYKKTVLIIAGIAVFLIGRVSKNQSAGLMEIKEIEKQEIKEIGEIKENEEIGNQKSEIEENKEIEKLRNLEIEEEANQTDQDNQRFQSNQRSVARVIDGDTIELENGQKVRYIGIDTPESVDPRKPVECFGKEASIKNDELVLGKKVRLEKDVSETDKYGRLLRYVYIGDTFINLELIKQGYASAATFPPDVKFSNLFKEAEKEAKEAGRGLWGKCGDGGEEKQPPPTASAETLVKADPSSSERSGISDCNIKGNISAKNEKIYHLSGCGSYDKTVIDEARGEKWFCSEEEAVEAGWRKAGNC